LQHWVDSAVTLSILIPGSKFVADEGGALISKSVLGKRLNNFAASKIDIIRNGVAKVSRSMNIASDASSIAGLRPSMANGNIGGVVNSVDSLRVYSNAFKNEMGKDVTAKSNIIGLNKQTVISKVDKVGGEAKKAGVIEGVDNAILSSEEAEKIAFNATKGPNNADDVVLGKYGDGGATAYTNVADSMDAQYFQLDNWDELASKYSDDEIWKINEKFLDIGTSSGREIYLSHNAEDYIGDGSFYSKEIQYLLDNGYKFVDEGGIWVAIRK